MPEKSNQHEQALVQIQKILQLADEKEFEQGEVIFEEGGEDKNFYIILQGTIEISKKTTDGQPKVIAHLESGEFLGEGVLSGITTKPATAKAISRATVMSLSRDKFDLLMKEDPHYVIDFLLSVLHAESSRLAETNNKVIGLFEISQLMNQFGDDLNELSKQLVNKLVSITKSKDGLLFLNNPFSNENRTVFTTNDQITHEHFKAFDLNMPQKVADDQGQFLIAGIKGLGAIAVRRERDYSAYNDDQLRLLALIAEQAAYVIKDASNRAAEKARKLLEQKRINL